MEEWKPVLDFEAAYEVSNLGRIRSIDRQVWREDSRRKGGGCFHSLKGRLLKPKTVSGSCRYYAVTLSHTISGRQIKRTQSMIHRLVWSAFNGRIPEGHQIDHIDNDPLNNCLDNLQCLSKTEHKIKTFSGRTGTLWTAPTSNLTCAEVEKIRKDAYNEGYLAGKEEYLSKTYSGSRDEDLQKAYLDGRESGYLQAFKDHNI